MLIATSWHSEVINEGYAESRRNRESESQRMGSIDYPGNNTVINEVGRDGGL